MGITFLHLSKYCLVMSYSFVYISSIAICWERTEQNQLHVKLDQQLQLTSYLHHCLNCLHPILIWCTLAVPAKYDATLRLKVRKYWSFIKRCSCLKEIPRSNDDKHKCKRSTVIPDLYIIHHCSMFPMLRMKHIECRSYLCCCTSGNILLMLHLQA